MTEDVSRVIEERTIPKAQQMLERVQAAPLQGQQHYEDFGARLVKAKTFRKNVWDEMAKIVDPAHLAHKNAVALRTKLVTGVDRVIEAIDGKMTGYRQNQEKLRLEQEAKLRKQAQEQFDRDRKKAEAQAAAAAKKGDEEKAARILDEVPTGPVSVVVMTQPPPKAVGTYAKKSWKVRILNEEKVPHEYRLCEPDIKLLESKAKSSNGRAKIPGVEFYEHETTAGRTKTK